MFATRLLALWFAAFVVLLFATTLHWQIANDASLLRYVTFLLGHGFAPYRDLLDINLPGTYFLDWLTTHIFGDGALGLRLYDTALLLLAGAAIVAVMPPKQKTAGFCAACLFALFHASDGAAQLGQRDLAIAALLLAAIALLVQLSRTGRLYLSALFGLTVGLAATVKPICLLFGLLLILTLRAGAIPAVQKAAPARRARRIRIALLAAAGLLLPLALLAAYLLQQHALHDFVEVMTVTVPFHAHIGFPGWRVLFAGLLTSSSWWLLGFALLLVSLNLSLTFEEKMALCGLALGALCFFSQLRGYNYHRYPFTACLMLLLALTVAGSSRGSRAVQTLGVTCAAFTTVLCPLYAAKARRTHWPAAMHTALREDLNAAGGKPVLDRSVQCIDTIGGCLHELYDMRLIQATGTLYDEFLFRADLPPALEQRRSAFLEQLQSNPPRAVVVTPRPFPSGPSSYQKLTQWPEFTVFLSSCYTLREDRYFPKDDPIEPGYRLYLRKPQCSRDTPAVERE
ncbi:MAG TPA: hypothetical protein VNW54_06605 [Granulicella sp.]|nr:hypothetical protein [Granulicella sp.]